MRSKLATRIGALEAQAAQVAAMQEAPSMLFVQENGRIRDIDGRPRTKEFVQQYRGSAPSLLVHFSDEPCMLPDSPIVGASYENTVTRVTGEMLASETAATGESERLHPETITHEGLKQRNKELWEKNFRAPDPTEKD